MFTVSLYFFKWRTFNSNTTGVISGVGTANPSGAQEFTSGFHWGSRCLIFFFVVVFCRLLFLLLVIVLSVSDYPFDIFNLFSITGTRG
jgi:hypothetical protein